MTCMALLVESHRSGCAARMCLDHLPIFPGKGLLCSALMSFARGPTQGPLQDQPPAKLLIMLV